MVGPEAQVKGRGEGGELEVEDRRRGGTSILLEGRLGRGLVEMIITTTSS